MAKKITAFDAFEEEDTTPLRPCEHPGCSQSGEFPAPKSRDNLREYYYFCLDHIREYNKQWDFFKGFSQDQIYDQMKKDTQWERPTWQPSAPINIETRLRDFIRRFTRDNDHDAQRPPPTTRLSREAQALDTLGLQPNADLKEVKARYRELVKRYHPDKNPDNPKALERFKIISEAYMIINEERQGKA